MKTLPEILRDAMVLLDEGRDSVVIARGQQHEPLDGSSAADQVRLRRAVDEGLCVYRTEERGWLGGRWSNWYERGHRLGGGSFDIDDVLATDWRISS